jgi:signal-transduction protein with cAMP-binding, CBS, and nucleotidyltransferase domain
MYQKIGDFSYKSGVLRLQGSVSVFSAIEIMDMYDTDIIAVECENDYAGIFTRQDFTRNVVRQNLNPKYTTLYEVMALETPIVEADATLKDAYDMMLKRKCEYLPVLDGKRLCGVVSMQDLSIDVMKSFEEAQNENEMMVRYIHGGESYGLASYGEQLEIRTK